MPEEIEVFIPDEDVKVIGRDESVASKYAVKPEFINESGVHIPDQQLKTGWNGLTFSGPSDLESQTSAPKAVTPKVEGMTRHDFRSSSERAMERWRAGIRAPIKWVTFLTLCAVGALVYEKNGSERFEQERSAHATEIAKAAAEAELTSHKDTGLSALELACTPIPEGVDCSSDAITRITAMSGRECCHVAGLKHGEDTTKAEDTQASTSSEAASR